MTDEQIRSHITRFDSDLAGLKGLFELALAFEISGTDDALRARIKVLEKALNEIHEESVQMMIDETPIRPTKIYNIAEAALAASLDDAPEPPAAEGSGA